jgi:ABC-type amino acid transport substrate-binding protein
VPFPPGFLFGTANADHQVEAHDPACEDVWDLWERVQGLTARGRATDFANRYEEDIAAAAAMGCGLFRFSIAWARVEPECGRFDEAALAHYREVADCVKRHGMKVMVTLHHFVWPLWLESGHGGMIGSGFPDLFARYAGRVAEELGDLADYWITINEPSQLTFGYIKPWWQNRYFMPPGLPRGATVDEEAEAVGKLVPNLFLAHARARQFIKRRHPDAKVGVNPMVTGFPSWLQMLMDWGACHRGLAEAVFKFTTSGALVRERGDVDLVIAGVTETDQTRFQVSDPYLRTGKALLVMKDAQENDINSLAGKDVAVIAVGNQPDAWRRDLPAAARKKVFPNYDAARDALASRQVAAVYGDAMFLLPPELRERGRFRFLASGLSDESYVVVAPHGHRRLLDRVNRAVAALGRELVGEPGVPWIAKAEAVAREAGRPVSLHEVFTGGDALPDNMTSSRGLRRIRRRGRVRIGIRTDAPGVSGNCTGEGLEIRLARLIAREVLGNEESLDIVPLAPMKASRTTRIESRLAQLGVLHDGGRGAPIRLRPHRACHARPHLRRHALPAQVGRSFRREGHPRLQSQPGKPRGDRPPRDRARHQPHRDRPRLRTSEMQLGLRILPLLPRDQKLIVQTKVAPTADPHLRVPATFVKSRWRSARPRSIMSICCRSTASTTASCSSRRCAPGGCLDAARNSSGRPRAHIGFSTHGPPVIVDAINTGEFDYVNLHWYWVNDHNWPAVRTPPATTWASSSSARTTRAANSTSRRKTRPPLRTAHADGLQRPLLPAPAGGPHPQHRRRAAVGFRRPHRGARTTRPGGRPSCRRSTAACASDGTRPRRRLAGPLGKGHPRVGEVPGHINVWEILRLWNYAKSLDMVEFGKMRYNLLRKRRALVSRASTRPPNSPSMTWSAALPR